MFVQLGVETVPVDARYSRVLQLEFVGSEEAVEVGDSIASSSHDFCNCTNSLLSLISPAAFVGKLFLDNLYHVLVRHGVVHPDPLRGKLGALAPDQGVLGVGGQRAMDRVTHVRHARSVTEDDSVLKIWRLAGLHFVIPHQNGFD